MSKKFRKELNPYGYMQLTKPLVKELGLNDGTFLCILIDAHDKWLYLHRLRSDGRFYYTYESVREDWGLTQYAQKKAIGRLVDLGLIEHKKLDGTDKWYYKIHIENIKKLLDGGGIENEGPHETVGSYSKDPIDSVGHDPMDSTGQTPSIHGVNNNIEQDHIEKEHIGKQELLQSEIESSWPGSLRSPKGSASVVTPSGGSNETSPDTHDNMVENINNTMVEGWEVKQCQDDDTSALQSDEVTFPSSSGGRQTGVADLGKCSKTCFGQFNRDSGECYECMQQGHCRQCQRDNRRMAQAEFKSDKFPKAESFDIEAVIKKALEV